MQIKIINLKNKAKITLLKNRKMADDSKVSITFDVISSVMLNIDYDKLLKLCATNKELYEKIWKSSYFWNQKYINDYGTLNYIPDDWRKEYKNMYNSGDVYATMNCPGLIQSFNSPPLAKVSPNDVKIKKIAIGRRSLFMIDIKDNVYIRTMDTKYKKFYDNTESLGHWLHKLKDVKAIDIFTGGDHVIFMNPDRTLSGFGDNKYGQLGIISDSGIIAKIFDSPVKTVACGSRHSMVLDNNGILWAAGDNKFGELGLGYKDDDHHTWTKINISNVTSVKCDGLTSAVLKSDGTIWICGSTTWNNDKWNELAAAKIPAFTEITGNIAKNLITCNWAYITYVDINGYLILSGRHEFIPDDIYDKLHRKKFEYEISNACGVLRSISFISKRKLYGVGNNTMGKLGVKMVSQFDVYQTPVEVDTIGIPTKVCCDNEYMAVIIKNV